MPFPATSATKWGIPGVDYLLHKALGPCIQANDCDCGCPGSIRWPNVRVHFSVTAAGHTITGGTGSDSPYVLTPILAQCGPTGTHLDGSHFCPPARGRKCCNCICHYFLPQLELPGDPSTEACTLIYPTIADWPTVRTGGADGGDGHIKLLEGITFNIVPGAPLGGCNPAAGGAENTFRTLCQFVATVAVTGHDGNQIRFGGLPIGPEAGLLSGTLDCLTFTCTCPYPLFAKFSPLYWQPQPDFPDPLDGYIIVEADAPLPDVKCPDTADCPPVSQDELANTGPPGDDGGGGGFTAGKPRILKARPAIAGPLGVGGHLAMNLEGMGVKQGNGCGCEGMARQMDIWGPEACRRQHRYLEHYLRQQIGAVKWADRIPAGVRAAVTGQFLNPWDPAPQLIETAIRRAERGR